MQKRLDLKNRPVFMKSLSKEDQMMYYSVWYYAAIHIIISIEQFQTKEAISKYFGLSQKRVSEVLEFLTSIGLAIHEHGRYRMGNARIHLASDSPMIAKQHTNCRPSNH